MDQAQRKQIREKIAAHVGVSEETVRGISGLSELGVISAQDRIDLMSYLAGQYGLEVDEDEAAKVLYLAQVFDLLDR